MKLDSADEEALGNISSIISWVRVLSTLMAYFM